MMTDPNWLISCLLFVIGALLILATVLVWLLIEAKRSKAQTLATLEASIDRHKATLREQRDELAVIEGEHQAQLEGLAKGHNRELDGMRGILALADLDRDEALRNTSETTRHNSTLRDHLDEIMALIESWATGQDDTAKAIQHRLKQARGFAISNTHGLGTPQVEHSPAVIRMDLGRSVASAI